MSSNNEKIYTIKDVMNILENLNKDDLVETEHFIFQHNERFPELRYYQ
ncbi:MAG: hypothetical protein ABGW92_03450 [Methanocaldococcus sp.]